MDGYSGRLTASFLTMADDLKREFELRIAESTNLAFRVAFGVLRNREDAEDVAQDAFAKAYRSFSKLRDRESFRAWLVRLTWRLALDHQRSRKRRVLREEIHGEVSGRERSSLEAALESERAERLWLAIDALPEKQRIVIVLANIEEHTTQEVAVLLGLPEGTVKSRLFHARQRLTEILK
jgi:RNA polymerase sigma-70 factor (ECF subfamily)